MNPGPSHTILAVNDRQDQLRQLASTLELAEYTVLKSTNLNAALRLAITQHTDLIIIDISKEQAAIDLHRGVRANPQTADIPILVISADTEKYRSNFDIDSTKDDLLETPYQPLALAARVARLIERKRTQDELRLSQERYYKLFHNANDVVYTTNLKGGYTSLNEKGQEITGYSSDEIAHVELKSLASPEDVELAHRMFQKKLQGQETNTVYEISIRAKDGTMIPFEVNSQLIFDNGKPVGVQGIARDVRARKEAELQLLEAERRGKTEYKILVERIAQLAQVLASARQLEQIFNALLEFTKISLPCNALGIALYDHEQVELTPHFLWLEERHVNLTNAEPFPVIDNSDLRRAILSAETITSTCSPEQSILRLFQNTARLNVSSMIVPMTIMGRTIGILEIQSPDNDAYQSEHVVAVQMAANLAANAIENVRLLNREREQETQLQQSRKMEAIGQLAGGVAHDFNNLITVVFGNCDSLLRGLEPTNPLRRHVFDIQQSGKRAAMLTKQLLAYSRQQVRKPVNLNLNSVVTHIMDQMISRLIGEDILITCKLADDLPPITADKNQLEQIIINLAVNARDAMPTGGTITIETSVVNPDKRHGKKHPLNDSTPHVQLSITDTGVGMSPEIQKKIFLPFFTTKSEGKGTGLGLSTVWGLANQSGASISVSSTEGKGTTFTLHFPVANGSFDTSVDVIYEPIEGTLSTQTTILLAEDDASVRQQVKDSLIHAGYTILEAMDGLHALELLDQYDDQIQLLITDVLMPRMNGRDLALRISDLRSTIQVLYISGCPRDVITDRGVLIEGVNFLEKPFDGNDLVLTVRQILSSQERVM